MQECSENKKYISYGLNKFGFDKIDLLISKINSPGFSFQFILNLYTKEIDFVSKNVRSILGVKPDSWTHKLFLERIHPEDIRHVEHCEAFTTFFLLEFVEKSESAFYRASYRYRLRMKSNNFALFLHNAMIIKDYKEGNSKYILTNVSEIKYRKSVNHYRMSFLDSRNKKSYININCADNFLHGCSGRLAISNREVNIIKLLSEGYTSKEIGRQLNISYETVRTHRNNILKKTKFKTLTHVVSYYIRSGLI